MGNWPLALWTVKLLNNIDLAKTVIICCETLQNELNKVFEITGRAIPAIWISADYHVNPNKLRERLQWEIDRLHGYERILLGFGRCGNAVIGLRATTADLIIPRADDCIDILLSRKDVRLKRKYNTYFLSKGWLQSTKGIINQHAQLVERYGQSRAGKLMKDMLNRYNFLMFIDTGVVERDELNRLLEASERFASDTDLELVVEKGEFWLLEALVQGLLEKEFIVVRKGEKVLISAVL